MKTLSLTTSLIIAFAFVGQTLNGQCPNSRTSSISVSISHQNQDDEKDIVETAVGAKIFKTLVAAVKAADLVEVLQGEGPFTVFAPTDEAFEALPEGTVEMLLKPENKDKLVAILTYHVVSGSVKAADVVKLEEAETVQGQMVKIKVEDDKVMINDATVVKTDIACSNGIIHVIDKVILPSEDKHNDHKKDGSK